MAEAAEIACPPTQKRLQDRAEELPEVCNWLALCRIASGTSFWSVLTSIPSFMPMILVAACFMDAPAAFAYYKVAMLPPTHQLLACYKLMVYLHRA